MRPLHFLSILEVLFLLALSPGQSPAQGDEIPYSRFTPRDGLPHEIVNTLAQTDDGQLWIGTRTGLAVYDGRTFSTIPLPDSLRGSSVTNLQPMPDGSVWAALSGRGLVCVRNRWDVATAPALKGTFIERLLAQGDTLYVVTGTAVWTRLPDGPRFERQPFLYEAKPPAMLDAYPRSGTGAFDAEQGPDGAIWILDGRLGPGRVRSDGSIAFVGMTARTSNLWQSLRIGPGGRLLMTRHWSSRLIAFDPSTGSADTLAHELNGANTLSQHGHTLFATSLHGVIRVDLRTDHVRPRFGPRMGLPDVIPTTAFVDRARTVWIGTRDGLLHLHAPSFRHLRSVRGWELRNVHRFMPGAPNQLWVHTFGSGLVQLRPGRRIATPDGIDKWGQGVRSADGRAHTVGFNLWYRTSTGGTWERVGTAPGAVRGHVDSSGTALFWHDTGLYRHRPSSPAAPTPLFQWPTRDRDMHMIDVTPGGRLLLRAHDWLFHLQSAGAEAPPVDTLAHLPGFQNARGRYMATAPSGDVWMAFWDRGLLHITINGKPPRPHLHLSDQPLRSVSLSGDSLVLAAAKNGLHLLSARTDSTLRHLTSNDGLLNNYVNAATVYGDSLYTSHPSGITILPLDAALQGPSPPKPVLTALRVNHRLRTLHHTLRLAASERALDVSFAAPYLPNPRRVTFETRLLPTDTTWTSTTRATRQFTNLDPGSYRFQVRARLGGSTGPPANLAFSVAPFFYETWWFVGLCGLGFFGLAILAVRWRLYRLRRRKERLEQTVKNRTRALRAEKQKTEKQAERLAELDEAKNRFFANLSHEFRTPLTLIRGPLRDLLEDDRSLLPDGLHDTLRGMLHNTRRLQRLIDQLLDLSKLTAGRMELQRKQIDLVAFARHLHEAFTPHAERKNLRFIFRPAVNALPVSVDPNKLEQILSNLVSNALKFTPAKGTVWLTVTREHGSDADTAHVVVKDTGPGIPEADLQRIFDRFEQVDGSKTRPHEGTGLGLALTRELVELHGGSIRVESEPDVGSAFTVQFPVASETDTALEAWAPSSTAQAPARSAPGASTSANGTPEDATILVVEDNAEVRAYLRPHLSATYTVCEATTGAEALDRIRDHPPDLVLSDVMMPEMDGLSLCQAIKADEKLCTIPVILLTARAAVEDTVEGLEHGADDYVAKPFNVRELMHRIERLLATRQTLRDEYEQSVHFERADLHVEGGSVDLMERVLTAIDASIGNPDYTVDALASDVGLSRRQLTRRLREDAGESPAALIRRLRLERAAELFVETPTATVAEVAYAVGFRSASHFSTTFGDHYDCPPSQYPPDS